MFLKVLQDSLFGIRGGSNLLLPRVDLASLFPAAAAAWASAPPTAERPGQARVHCGVRVDSLVWQAPHWLVNAGAFRQGDLGHFSIKCG